MQAGRSCTGTRTPSPHRGRRNRSFSTARAARAPDGWRILSGPTTVEIGDQDWTSHQYELARGAERRWIVVSIAKTARRVRLADPDLQAAVDTDGRSIAEMALWIDAPPREVRINSERSRPPLEHLRDPAGGPLPP